MNELSSDKAKEADFEWDTVEECINKLIECKKRGENVFVNIGNYVVYSKDAAKGLISQLEYLLYCDKDEHYNKMYNPNIDSGEER